MRQTLILLLVASIGAAGSYLISHSPQPDAWKLPALVVLWFALMRLASRLERPGAGRGGVSG